MRRLHSIAGLSVWTAASENRDPAVAIDFRDVFTEILEKRLGPADLRPLFPAYGLDKRKRLRLAVT